jgi:hypothetical protein
MTLEDLTWQFDSGVVLNDDSIQPFVDVTEVTGFDSATYRETVRDHEGVDGGFLDAEFETGRDIILDGAAYSDVETIEAFLDELKANFAPRASPAPLVFKAAGRDERVVFVKSRGVRYKWQQEYRLGIVPLQILMYAEDPRFYDNAIQSVVIPFGGPATTGFGFSLGFNFGFGAVVPPSSGTVVVGGNRPTPATLTVQGPVVNPRIINTTDGLTLSFLITLGASDILTIDLANRTATLNGVSNVRSTLVEPNWWLFNPGSTSLVFGGGSGTGTLTVQYRNAWR